jgi:hypothetical protein
MEKQESKKRDIFSSKWIIENSIEIIERYEKGILTIRALFYQLVSIGMTNSDKHYKRVVKAMIDARWSGDVEFDTFSDRDRTMVGETKYMETVYDDKVSEAKRQLGLWMTSYSKNRWENQPYYPEILIEKKALEGVFDSICRTNRITLGACKGYPSLTFLYEMSERMKLAEERGKKCVILYFGDYDPSGEDIPRSIKENLIKLGIYDIELRRIMLMERQVIEWELPPAPAKLTDSRTANWEGLGQVELDAVEPRKLQRICQEAIDEIFDFSLYDELLEEENKEAVDFTIDLRNYVNDEL